jgi:uncharacterized protein (DUF2252 family)
MSIAPIDAASEVSPNGTMNGLPGCDSCKQKGKALRKACPRSSHGEVILGQDKRDPLALLEESNQDRLPDLLPVRFTRMAESAFAFFRGSAILQAHDLQGTPSVGITVQCCGDCHLMNFGVFATPERSLAFDINDFDETLPGPFEWDLKRLTTSFILAGRWLGFKNSDCIDAATAAVASYHHAISHFAELSVLETWYAKITLNDLLEIANNNEEIQRLIKKDLRKAQENTSDHVFHKMTVLSEGEPQIVDHPPLVFHSKNHAQFMETDVQPFFERYRSTLPPDRQALFDRYRLIDSAYKVVGVGSVGTRCAIALFLDYHNSPLFLQVKEARPSVLQGRAGPCSFSNNGERVVIGQRLMQSASDIFLGWTKGPEGRNFYVRQLRDMKVAPTLTEYSPRSLIAYASLCGKTLARAHAKSGDAAAIAGYLGSGDAFDNAVAEYAVGYADQVEKDYDSFRAAIRKGRFPVETMPSELEQAIR